MKRRWTWAIALLVSMPAFAARPNFSGEWHLNLDKTDYGPDYDVPTPTRLVQKILHKDPNLTLDQSETVQGAERAGTVKYTTDGSEVVNQVMGNTMRATAMWDGNVLVIHTWGDFNGSRIDLIDRWSLEDKGKTLIVRRHFEGMGRKADHYIVLGKAARETSQKASKTQ